MSAGFSTNFATIVRNNFDTVGKKETPLSKLTIAVDTRRWNKEEEKYKTVKTSFFDAVVWGDKAQEIALLDKGTVLDLSAQIKENKNGEQYISFRAFIEENSWEDKNGEEKSKPEITIRDWEVRNFN